MQCQISKICHTHMQCQISRTCQTCITRMLYLSNFKYMSHKCSTHVKYVEFHTYVTHVCIGNLRIHTYWNITHSSRSDYTHPISRTYRTRSTHMSRASNFTHMSHTQQRSTLCEHTRNAAQKHCRTLQHAFSVSCVCTPLQNTHYKNCTHTATQCNTLQHTVKHCKTLPHTTTHCNTLQHIRNTLQHTATLCNSLGLRVASVPPPTFVAVFCTHIRICTYTHVWHGEKCGCMYNAYRREVGGWGRVPFSRI